MVPFLPIPAIRRSRAVTKSLLISVAHRKTFSIFLALANTLMACEAALPSVGLGQFFELRKLGKCSLLHAAVVLDFVSAKPRSLRR